MSSLKICSVSAELAPYASTGGLGEMCASLHRQLGLGGHDVRAIVPFHERVVSRAPVQTVAGLEDLRLRLGESEYGFEVLRPTDAPGTVYMIRCPELFARPGIYASDGDEHIRFAFLCRAALEVCDRLEWAPHVIHLHDWHTALVPLLLQTVFGGNRRFSSTRTVLTLHNVGYQGVFSPSALSDIGLAGQISFFSGSDLEQGRISFLTTGVLYADHLTTVSRSYAAEIQQEPGGAGLATLLQARADRLIGIVNGIDTEEWDPATDPRIAANYSAADLSGKAVCRQALLQEFDLTDTGDEPVLAVISRLTPQKGLDLVMEPLQAAVLDGCRIVVLGSGDADLEERFRLLHDQLPDRVGLHIGFDTDLAHRIQAGADMVLMPSRWEPCGLTQLYGLRYGTVPLVRRTGGLADTVIDAQDPDGTGFVFSDPTPSAFHSCLDRARGVFTNPPAWQELMRRGMRQDWSWAHQSQHYLDLYGHLRQNRE